MKSLDALNGEVVAKRTELAQLPAELLSLKDQFAALEAKNEAMLREKRSILQDIESATKTRDSLKLFSRQEVKEWSGELEALVGNNFRKHMHREVTIFVSFVFFVLGFVFQTP